MAKDIDLKQFMLARGERVGLWVAVGLMVILVAFGAYSTFTSASPTDVANMIDARRKSVVDRIDFGGNTTPPEIPEQVSKLIHNPAVPPEKYPQTTANFSPNSSMEDTKRQNPTVLGLAEWVLDVVRGSVTCYDVVQEGNNYKIGILVPVDKEKTKVVENAATSKSRNQIIYERLQKLYPQQLPPVRFDLQGMKRNDIIARILNNLEAAPKFELKHVSPEEAEKLGEQTGKYAKTMYPARMIMVSASFPYKEQLEAFRRAMRKPTIQELLKEKDFIPQFLGIDVQRRVVKAGTPLKPEEGWEDVDTVTDKTAEKNKFHWATYRWLLGRSVNREPEDAEQEKTVIFNRMMVMPRPELGRGEYPKAKLKTIDTTLQNWQKHLQKTGQAAPTLHNSILNRKLSGDVDVLADKEKEDASPGAAPPTDASKAPPFAPDYCLLRFLDLTVRPGNTYEYRVRVRLNNPNFGKPKDVAFPFLAEIRELEGPWSVLPAITVPSEFYYYAEKDPPRIARAKDRVFVQIHRWLDFIPLDPASTDTMVPIADWAIADVPVMRGEYIGKVMDNTQVVMWYPTQEHFDFAIGSKNIRPRPVVLPGYKPPPFVPPPKVVSVDFTTNPRALLVDFEGGETQLQVKEGKNVRTIKDDSSIEVLVLTEDGKLQVRNSAIDENNSDRKKRHDHWAEEVKKVKEKPTALRTSNPKDKDDPFKDKPK